MQKHQKTAHEHTNKYNIQQQQQNSVAAKANKVCTNIEKQNVTTPTKTNKRTQKKTTQNIAAAKKETYININKA